MSYFIFRVQLENIDCIFECIGAVGPLLIKQYSQHVCYISFVIRTYCHHYDVSYSIITAYVFPCILYIS